MRLGTIVNHCMLFYRDGSFARMPRRLRAEIDPLFREYMILFPEARPQACWYDLRYQVVFSGAQYRGGPGRKDHHFKAPAEDFLDGAWGIDYVRQSLGKAISKNDWSILAGEDCIYSNHPGLDKYRGKSLLILLGGPSTRDVAWEGLHTDFVWSCNKFYLNPRITRQQPDLVSLAPNVDLDDPLLIDFLDRTQTLIAFEAERGYPFNIWDHTSDFIRKYEDRCLFFHPRYDSAIGVGPRIVSYAACLGFRDIYFVGIDGLTPAGPQHAFEPGKGNPEWYRRHGPALQNRHFVILGQYLQEIARRHGVGLHNLGERHPANVLGPLSRRFFPLSKADRRAAGIRSPRPSLSGTQPALTAALYMRMAVKPALGEVRQEFRKVRQLAPWFLISWHTAVVLLTVFALYFTNLLSLPPELAGKGSPGELGFSPTTKNEPLPWWAGPSTADSGRAETVRLWPTGEGVPNANERQNDH